MYASEINCSGVTSLLKWFSICNATFYPSYGCFTVLCNSVIFSSLSHSNARALVFEQRSSAWPVCHYLPLLPVLDVLDGRTGVWEFDKPTGGR